MQENFTNFCFSVNSIPKILFYVLCLLRYFLTYYYYLKFIEAYEAQNIPVWGLTIQNEPMATQRWESCIYTAEEERDFLKYFLGPTLEKAGHGNKKIVVWDHNRDLISNRANTIFEDPEAWKKLLRKHL